MSGPRPLLMIPGPIEISPAVLEAFAVPPPAHLAPAVIDAFGASLEMMRRVWLADPSAHPFIVAGGGTLAMDMVAANLLEPGEGALVVNTGYFSDRMVEMLERRGVEVTQARAAVGDAPSEAAVREALEIPLRGGSLKAIFATHVDTSTGVLVDPAPLSRIARENGLLTVFDGVCAVAGERFDMEGLGADVYLTASQKAIGLPPGLALMVVSERAFEVRAARRGPAPPMFLDWMEWEPIVRAYEARRPAYFSTPATNLVLALETGLREILDEGIEARVARHERAARAMRAAWAQLGLSPVPVREELQAHTLSALHLPDGVDGSLVARILDQGVIVAGGLHPALRGRYFRVGHMGYAVTRPDMLVRTARAVGNALRESGGNGASVDVNAAVDAVQASLADSSPS